MQTLTDVPKFNDLDLGSSSIKAIFWDMDGTLCNTEFVHAKALVQILQKFHSKLSKSPDELESYGVGLTDSMVLKKLQSEGELLSLSENEFLDMKNSLFLSTLKNISNEQFFKQQIKELISEVKERGIKLALVTSSERPVTELILNRLALAHLFDLIITQEDTEKNKPFPDPYLLAMKNLNIPANDVLIFEDSVPGLAAAKASGANYFKVKWY